MAINEITLVQHAAMASAARALMFTLALGSCRAYMPGAAPSRRLCAQRCAAVLTVEASTSNGSAEVSKAVTPAGDAPVAKSAEGPPTAILEESDLINTRWTVTFTPRPDAWRGGRPEEQEFALLEDGTVRWAGKAGGTGVGGRWQLRGDTLEVIRTTPLGLVTGRDYYMSLVQAQVCLLLPWPGLPRQANGNPGKRRVTCSSGRGALCSGDKRSAVRAGGHHALVQLALSRRCRGGLEGQAAAGPLRRREERGGGRRLQWRRWLLLPEAVRLQFVSAGLRVNTHAPTHRDRTSEERGVSARSEKCG